MTGKLLGMTSLTDAERTEHAVQDVLDVDGPDELLKQSRRLSQVNRGHHGGHGATFEGAMKLL
jgi:hypothetical protein